MTPAAAISMLDRSLASSGEIVTLQKMSGASPVAAVDCPAFVRGDAEQDIVGAIGQNLQVVTVSPTPIVAAAWPGSQPAQGADVRIPVKGDRVKVQGAWRAVQSAAGFYLQGQLVRLEIKVKG